MKTTVIHVIAQCAGCSWRSEDYVNGEKDARIHNRDTGHRVNVELGTTYYLPAALIVERK